jgi:serralysin
VSGEDRLELMSTVFQALGPSGNLAPEAFRIGASAVDTSNRVLYDPTTGALFYDPDGSGDQDAVQFAVLSPTTALVASDIWVG